MQDFQQVDDTVGYLLILEQHLLVLQLKGQVRTDIVERDDIVGDIVDGKLCLIGYLVMDMYVVLGRVPQVLHGSGKLHVILFWQYLGE